MTLPRTLINVVAIVFSICFITSAMGSYIDLDADNFPAGSRIPDSGAYMRTWSASISGLITSQGLFTDYWARNNFMSHIAYSVAPTTGISASTFSRVYGYTTVSGSSNYDGNSMHVLFGSYSSSLGTLGGFNYHPTSYVSIDVLWPTTSLSSTYMDFKAYGVNDTLLGTYRYGKKPGSFTRISLFAPDITHISIVPPGDGYYDNYGLDNLYFMESSKGTDFNLDDNQTINAPVGMTLTNADSLAGNGTINGSLINDGGIVTPGNSTGKIAINGSFTQNLSGKTVMEIGNGENDEINISGEVSFDGILEIMLMDGTAFEGDEIITLMTYGSRYGIFDEVLGLDFEGGHFDLNYGDTALTLTANAVPIPGAVWLLGSGLFSIVGMRRKYKK